MLPREIRALPVDELRVRPDPECHANHFAHNLADHERFRHAVHFATNLGHHPQLRQHSDRFQIQRREPDNVEEQIPVEIAMDKARQHHARQHHVGDRERVVLLLVGVRVGLVAAIHHVSRQNQRAEVHQLVEVVPTPIDRNVPQHRCNTNQIRGKKTLRHERESMGRQPPPT